MNYTATYPMADGTPCHVGGGATVQEAILSALWVIDYDGLDDAKVIHILQGDELVACYEVA